MLYNIKERVKQTKPGKRKQIDNNKNFLFFVTRYTKKHFEQNRDAIVKYMT